MADAVTPFLRVTLRSHLLSKLWNFPPDAINIFVKNIHRDPGSAAWYFVQLGGH